METMRNEREEDKDFKAYQVRAMSLNKYNNLLTSWRWYNKDTKDAPILDIAGVSEKDSRWLQENI